MDSDWNVVVTVRDDGYTHARDILQQVADVVETQLYNVILLRADDIPGFLAAIDRLLAEHPSLRDAVARILPLTHIFDAQAVPDLERRFEAVATGWLDRLAARSFHVRLHARGWSREISRLAEERVLDSVVLRGLEARGTPGRLEFEEPDAVIDVEVVDHRAGMALWTREDLARHPFLRVD